MMDIEFWPGSLTLDMLTSCSACYNYEVMKLTDDQVRELARVAAASNRLEGAREDLRESVFDALDAGAPLLRVADASGIARTTILRWIDAEEIETV